MNKVYMSQRNVNGISIISVRNNKGYIKELMQPTKGGKQRQFNEALQQTILEAKQ